MSLAAAGIGAISALLISWLVRRSERKRDDVKWEREAADRAAERERDEVRWHREHKRERNFKAFEERKLAYAAMLVKFLEWRTELIEWSNELLKDIAASPDWDKLERCERDCVYAKAALQLLGSDPVNQTADVAQERLWDYQYYLNECSEHGEFNDERGLLFGKLMDSISAFHRAARDDIDRLLATT